MDFYVIGDEDTVVGFRFAGVPGRVVRNAREAAEALRELTQDEREVITIVPEQVADMIREEINAVRFGESLPLVVEIPGPGGPREDAPSLLEMIGQAVGFKI